MKEKIEMGGPAFPVSTAEASEGHQDGPNTWQFPGMTLRDYFAAKAMPSCYAEYCAYANLHGYSEDWRMGVALDSYAMADAMLKARDRGVGQSENGPRVASWPYDSEGTPVEVAQ